MNWIVTAIVVVVLLDLAVVGGLWALAAYSKANPPSDAGPGRLARSPKRNVVGSLVDRPALRVSPLGFGGGKGEADRAWAAARAAVLELPKTRIVREAPGYLHAECASAIFGFVDDLELEFAPGGQAIHLRSASRVGRSDFGANRGRIERLREVYLEILAAGGGGNDE